MSKKRKPVRRLRRNPDCQFTDCTYFGETDVYGLCPIHNKEAHENVGISLHVYKKGRD